MVQDIRGRRSATELLFLDRGPLLLRAAILTTAATASGLAGFVLLRLHLQLTARLGRGATLNPVETLIASGSSWRTLWPGWLAAVFFLIALVRLRRGPMEPAPGRRTPEQLTPAQLRRGLRAEYLVVRALLVVVSLVAAVDAARTITHVVYAVRGNRAVATALPATIAEAAGLVTAAVVLAAWAWTFGGDVRRLGAL